MQITKANISNKVFALLVAGLLSLFVVKTGVMGIGLMLVFPFVLAGGIFMMSHPNKSLAAGLIFAFLSIGAIRYVPNLPLGLTVDFALAMLIVSALFHNKVETDFSKLHNSLILVTLIWMGYNVAEIFNPEARSVTAWFYAVRGTALYMFLTVPLTLLYANKPSDLNRLFIIVFALSILASFWGLRQFYIGLDYAENRWLDAGSRSTHVLFGNLRVFSFFSDAGQFGAGIAHSGVMAMVLALGPFSLKKRILFAVMALLFFYLMIMSGTRGALMVPVAGSLAYLFASKNYRLMLAGLIALGLAFSFLKFTTIANNNYQVRRMRSALDPSDPSLNVRYLNQRKFSEYLKTRPFGGGIGTSGSWGQRFSPGTFLAETPNDSWFVKIWAEMGIVGLYLHIGILAFIAGMGLLKIWKVKDPRLRQKLLALFGGYVGIAAASYGNPLLGQMPTGIILYMSWAYFFLAEDMDKSLNKPSENE
ncbi:MAG: O-antigen ligase family protein [Cytophagales bacterium]|uniref:O-antigen ligase family protein n=1 Tax=Cyclobacterium marinum TaxID=104 RepID=UPI0030D997B9|nr:O-antigen ligase family protein [Cytophagales bacterium]|tara:strand:- start:125428 stop:126855 length:1428 start_codon:yes stop_codon:yes gene_type:complete